MRIIHVVSGLQKASGVTTFVEHLVAELRVCGHEVEVFTKETPGETSARLMAACDLVHIHGLWDLWLHRWANVARKAGVKVVWSPHGMLTPWALRNKWWKKLPALVLYQWHDLRRAAALHVTASSEVADVRRLWLKNPIVEAPLGVSVKSCGRTNTLERWECDASRRALAEQVIVEWLEGVTEEAFAAALEQVVEEKFALGEYRFKRESERDCAIDGARLFFAMFSRKIVELSDGRCVYFAPDSRAKRRNADNAISWAEYAFHAVSSGGNKVSGKDYHERWYNPHKMSALQSIESVLRDERCFVRLSKVDVRYDAVVFAGAMPLTQQSLQIVTRLDEQGNMDANLTEVTFVASHKREKKAPRVVPLPEAVKTVVHHQITAGSNPPDRGSISKLSEMCKGSDTRWGDEEGAGMEMAARRAQKTLLFVSRVQRKKGLPNLLSAWSRLSESVREGWRIRIVGPDEDGHTAELKRQAESLGIAESVDFVGPRYGMDLDSEYRSADLFVLPTHSENFGSVVIEALAYGLPVICTKGAPWAELVTHRCGWWVADSVEALTVALKAGVLLPSEALRDMGAHGRKLVEEKYTWKAVCDAMIEGYRRALNV